MAAVSLITSSFIEFTSDGALVRTVTGTKPSFSLVDFTAVTNLTRDLTANAAYLIQDVTLDAVGQTTFTKDGRGNENKAEYDSRGRVIRRIEAYGTAIAATIESESWWRARSHQLDGRG